MTKLSEIDRAKGVLAGLSIGDALGRPVEGLSPTEIRAKYGSIKNFLTEKPGGSDDTEYAIATALALLKHGKNTTANNFADYWRENICPQSESFLGAGFSEMLAISNLNKGLNPPESGVHIHSWSDGLAMRVAPCGIVGRGDIALTKELTIADGQVSHAGEGIESGLAIAIAISLAMDGMAHQEIVPSMMQHLDHDSWSYRSIMKAVKIREEFPDLAMADVVDKLVEAIATHDYAFADLGPEAVALAISAVLFGEGDFAQTLLFAVNLGRDADTIAAMAGAIIGGIVGYEAIPDYWRNSLLPVEGSCLAFTKGIDPVNLAEGLVSL